MAYRKVLIPVDFSEYSETAFRYALSFAKQTGARLSLAHVSTALHCSRTELYGDSPELDDALRAHVQRLQRQISRYIGEANREDVPVDYAILEADDVVNKLLDYLAEHAYDLVIMGTHGRTGLKHLFLGSIAEKIVRYSPVPVLTLHKCAGDCRIRKILVPVGFSRHSLEAIENAVDLAQGLGGSVMLLHVIERVIYPAFYPEGYTPVIDFEPQLHQRIMNKLNHLIEDYPGVSVDARISAGKPSDEIIEHARSHNAGLIVMATRGLSGLEHLLVGSTTERVMRLSEVPVLAFRTAPDRNPAPTANYQNDTGRIEK